MSKYEDLIQKVIYACVDRNAKRFASLFSPEGKIIFNQNYCVYQPEIEKITAEYFKNLSTIKINIINMSIKKNKAFIEWDWYDYNVVKQKENIHRNVIILEFQDDLISQWIEY